ncbi:DUF2569 family protein [uncultured Ruthenibacterium sp.]|uniref:DUF2569 family protein n=1 Tax=uncultured Ruthenibacterium sp. TaxID=1905347 RepID=UPI00349E4A24
MPQKDYRKLGGWLLFFAVILGIGFFSNLVSLMSSLAYLNVNLLLTILMIACVVAQGVMFYQIVARRPNYWRCLILLVALLTISDLYTLWYVGFNAQFVTSVVVDLIRSAIWLAYFHKSKRVAVYFAQSVPFDQPYPNVQTGASGYCPYCGSAVSDDAIFCGHCGRSLR